MLPAELKPRGARTRMETLGCLAIALAAAWFYFWSVSQPVSAEKFATRTPAGYYPLQAAGYRSGHLYLALDVHPALLALKDPYDPVANAPYRVHDLSLYAGHYYMYFGATPVVLLFWPVAALTGWYPTEPFAVAFFCTGAVWAGIALLLAVKRRHFPEVSSWYLLLGSACLAFATPLTTLAEGPQFYQVPISCAIFLQALMLGAGYISMHSKRRANWLALAGLALGLSFGARPNYLLSSLALLVPVAFAVRARPEVANGLRSLVGWGFIAYLPALLCGIGLIAYNHARFGSFGEFGMHFQLAGERVTDLQAISPRFILPHYRDYLLGSGLWQTYFPFFSPVAGKPFGILRYVPWTLLGVFAFLRFSPRSERGSFALMVGVAAWANLTLLSCFFGTTQRYPGDFTQALLLLSGMGALVVGECAAKGPTRRLPSLMLGALALASVFFSAAVYFSGFPSQDGFLRLARLANLPYYEWRNVHKEQSSGMSLQLELPAHGPSLAEPILETGRQPDQRDWLQVEYIGDTKARLSFFHAGTGFFEGKVFTLPADRRIKVDVRAGSLFPPYSYPAFSDWSRDDYDRARRRLLVNVDDAKVLDLALDCYESSPSDVRIGRMGWFTGGMQQVFTGKVLSVRRLPLERPPAEAPEFTTASPIEMTVNLPSAKTGGADPILVTGKGDKSDLVYCIYDGINRVKFAFDHWGNGGPQSETVSYDPLVQHKITILDEAMAGLSKGRLAVVFDGKPLINIIQVFYPSTPDTVLLGYNKFGSTGAGHQFSGTILGYEMVSLDTIPAINTSGAFGPVEL
ncbi:MAG TPA: hypothetical protein VFE25_13180, partial [Opitutaceae bacterium]|nr:hypothetical protein [Opitutaceae bacterium]